MTDEGERTLDLIRAWQRYRENTEFELDQLKRRSKELRDTINHADKQIRAAIHQTGGQQILDGMDDVQFPPTRPSWRDASLAVVIGDEAIIEKLEGAGLTNFGELADYTEQGGSLCKQVGLTEHQEHRVIEAMQVYWGQPNADV